MTGTRELHLYTAEQAQQHIGDAVAIVEALDVPTDLRVPAFEKACEMLSRKEVTIDQLVPTMAIPRGKAV